MSGLDIARLTAMSPIRRDQFSDSDDVKPYLIDISEGFIEETIAKVRLTRFPVPLIDEDDNDPECPPLSFAMGLQKYWSESYKWSEIQDRLNADFPHFQTTLSIASVSPYKDSLPIHFVHKRSSSPTALALLFIHGWPGSFLEVRHLIHDLPIAQPRRSSNPTHPADPIPTTAFHIVAPSLPGSGFSPAPTRRGFGDRAAAHALHALMQRLGYTRYFIQGGDVGGIILRFQCGFYPQSVVAALSNFYPVSPAAADLVEHTGRVEKGKAGMAKGREGAAKVHAGVETVKEGIDQSDWFFGTNNQPGTWAYGQIQQQAPLRLAYGLTDSPVGFAMWIYDLIRGVVVDAARWDYETVITWAMMHYLQGPVGGMRWYQEGRRDGAFSITRWGDLPVIPPSVPIAISRFPGDVWTETPRSWIARTCTLIKTYTHDTGGHFPAFDSPDLLVADIRDFFGGYVDGELERMGRGKEGGKKGERRGKEGGKKGR